MKTDIKDFLLSTLAICLIVSATSLTVYFLNFATTRCFGGLSLLINALSFLLIYGLASALYLKFLRYLVPLREGIYGMDHPQFTLWKHHAVVGELGRNSLKFLFPVFMRPAFYSLFGSKIGKCTAIGGVITDPMLTKVEDYGVLGQDSVVTSHTMILNKFYIRPINVCTGATVGINAVLMPGVTVGENSVVAPGAVVLMGTVIPPNEFWGGVPARKIKDLSPFG